MPSIAIAAGIGAAGSIASGVIASSGAGKAADATLQAGREANALQEKIYNQNRTDILPWITSGGAALGRLDYLLGLNPGSTSSGAMQANYGPMGTAPSAGSWGGAGNASETAAQRYARLSGPARQWQSENDLSRLRDVSSVIDQGNVDVSAQGPGAGSWGAGGTPEATVSNPLPGIIGNYLPSSGPGALDPQGASTGTGTAFGATPGQTTGEAASGQFGSLMRDFGIPDFNVDPGYLFRLQEGQKALDRSAAARGGLFSGGTIRASDQYNQNFASNEYGNAYNRYQNNRQTKYNFLSGLAGLGSQNAQTLAGIGGDYANNAANIMTRSASNAAQLRASGYGALATGVGGAFGNLSGLAAYYAAMNQQLPKVTG
jgi:hypothetical protein